MATGTTKVVPAVQYSHWPTAAYGDAIPPSKPKAQWSAWISAGGQNDAVVVHAGDKANVLALRKHMLSGFRPTPIHRPPGADPIIPAKDQKDVLDSFWTMLRECEEKAENENSSFLRHQVEQLYDQWNRLTQSTAAPRWKENDGGSRPAPRP